MATFNTAIAASTDDADQAAGAVTTNATTLNANATSQYIGLRFLNVTIPQGATISAATLNVYFTSASFDSPNVLIYAEDVDDAATFTTGANDISGRTLTTANVAWNASNIGTGSKTSPDIATVIQEIIDRPGWASGNDIVIIIKGNSASSAMRIATYDSANPEAQINITYSTLFTQNVGGTLTPAGTVVKQSGKPLAGSLTTAGNPVKRAGKAVAGTLTTAGNPVKRTAKVSKGAAAVYVTASADDATEEDTTVSITPPTVTAEAGFLSGVIFRNVPIPAGSTVTAATLDGVIFEAVSNDDPNLTIRGEINPAAFSEAVESDLTNRTKTSAGVVWSASNVNPGAGLYVSSPDISTVIQEIIDGAWTAGDDIGLYLIDRGLGGAIYIYAYDYGPNTYPPRLTLEWTGPGYLWGGLTPTGTALKSTAKNLAGAVTFSGVVATAKTFIVAVGGALTSAGNVIKTTAKTAAGSLTSSGEVVKSTAKNVSGALTSSGAVATVKTFVMALEGALTTAGTVAKTTAKSVAGELTSAGAVVKSTAKNVAGSLTSAGSVLKSTAKNTAGALTTSGAVTTARTVLMALGGTLTTAGTVAKSTAKNVAGTLTSAGEVVKTTAKNVAGSITPSGAVSLVHQFAVFLSGALTTAGTVTKATAKNVAGSLTSAGGVVKSTSKALGGTLTTAGESLKTTAKNLAGSLASSGVAAAVSMGVQVVIALTARARDFSMTAAARDFSLTAAARDFSLSVQARAFALLARARDFSLTAKGRQ